MGNDKQDRSSEEIAQLGDEIYNRRIREHAERSHYGKIAAIDVNTEEYEIGDSALDAATALLARVADADIWLVRIGHRALHHIGAGRPEGR